MQKFQDDRWNTSPPSVTAFLSYPNTPGSVTSSKTSYVSPVCGFGWGFQFTRRHDYQISPKNPHVQELTGQVDILFQPRSCSGIQLKDISIHVTANFPLKGKGSSCKTLEKHYAAVPLNADYAIGTYLEPSQLAENALFEITLTFHWNNRLAFPTTPSSNTNASLVASLDGFSAIDTKFYLYSAKIGGQPGRPRAVFANAALVSSASSYIRDLVSEADFQGGIPCDLEKDAPEAMLKLDNNLYDYDSDSDLESLPDEGSESRTSLFASVDGKGDRVDQATPESDSTETVALGKMPETSLQGGGDSYVRHVRVQGRGKAFAINGTAYQTWKAFIFYAYTNKIHFNSLKSQENEPSPADSQNLGCSPKSMYRLADYAGMQTLKDISREGIRDRLSSENIVQELFSSFTYKHQELIDMEVDFLIDNMSPHVAREFDNILQLVILGVKPHCYRVLAFVIRSYLYRRLIVKARASGPQKVRDYLRRGNRLLGLEYINDIV
ncbi:hypothetical protein P691DRAFT_777242 [Macrolepiota fuliginosa MF-IS2]|uniref:Uncharacterized protein n=1 Tax=Macrolepiota fuliginosa MF-IS2 TaxID=1400762 RepID=A0A9P5X9L3_9AGAR|nr:hypothetical protein P691DRAFT_777242 [Macrolepiota fuliginosa MF-IS2]